MENPGHRAYLDLCTVWTLRVCWGKEDISPLIAVTYSYAKGGAIHLVTKSPPPFGKRQFFRDDYLIPGSVLRTDVVTDGKKIYAYKNSI